MKKPFQSIRVQIQVWHGSILFIVVAALSFVLFCLGWQFLSRGVVADLDSHEILLLSVVPESIGKNEEGAHELKLPTTVIDQFQGEKPGYLYFSIRDQDNRVLAQSKNFPEGADGLFAKNFTGKEELVGVGHSVGRRRLLSNHLVLVVGRNFSDEYKTMWEAGFIIGAVGIVIWVVGLVGGGALASKAIRPIEEISKTARRISQGNLLERIDRGSTQNELGDLSELLNTTFDRLQQMLEQQKQFTADASHELRTPISVLISETQRVLRRERTAAEYRSSLEVCHATAARARMLIESLLILAENDSNLPIPRTEICDLQSVGVDAVGRLHAMAESKAVTLKLDLHPAYCNADRESLSLVAMNLVRNAIQHNRTGGSVEVSTTMDENSALFAVRDDGPGISTVDLPHIFQRFYRANKARSSEEMHSGLGLAIAQAIVDRYTGKIEIESVEGHGATFRVRFPRVQPPMVARKMTTEGGNHA